MNGQMKRCIHVALASVALSATVHAANIVSETVVSRTELDKHVLTIEDIAPNGEINGFVKNTAAQRIDDIDLLVRYGWVWRTPDGHRSNDPSWAEYVHLDANGLEPGAALPFTYRPATPLPKREDGLFVPRVTVVAITKIKER